MERTLWGILGHGLMGLSGMGAVLLGFAWWGGGPEPAAKDVPGGWRLLEPITYENLTVFPVVSDGSADTSAFLTLEEGLTAGEVVVREQSGEAIVRSRDGSRPASSAGGPSVNQLVLVNRSKRPLLLLAGELVSGGKQDRVISKDRIVAPGAEPLPLDVFCVEHGRWSSGSQFTSAKTIVHPSVREKAAVEKEQAKVWESVTAGSMAYADGTARAAMPAPRVSSADIASAVSNEAPTQSYNKIYNSSRLGGSIDSFVEEVQRRFRKETSGLKGEQVVGVVVAYGGEVAWSDLFASGELFQQYWSKLLRSYAVEAVARPGLKEKATPEDAREFLRNLKGRETTESEPGVYRWMEVKEGALSQIELEALQPKPMALHRLTLRRTS